MADDVTGCTDNDCSSCCNPAAIYSYRHHIRGHFEQQLLMQPDTGIILYISYFEVAINDSASQ